MKKESTSGRDQSSRPVGEEGDQAKPDVSPVAGVRETLVSMGDERKAVILQRFFKTGPGQYGEGDRFLGIPVPYLRRLARNTGGLTLSNILLLLRSSIHEERFLALLLLIDLYRSGDENGRRAVYEAYLTHTEWINSWDLIDISAEHIVGHYLKDKEKGPLFLLAESENLWHRRIAVMATFNFIKVRAFSTTLQLARVLVQDREDLIQKAVGWMLREVGKRDMETEEHFLREHYRRMPRTMLRYAIERFAEEKRQAYLKGTI